MSLRHRIGPRVLPKGKLEQRTLKRKASLNESDVKPRFPNRQWVRPPDTSRGIASSSNFDQAQVLLDDVASSMRPYKVPKTEPVEPSLADVSFWLPIARLRYPSLIWFLPSRPIAEGRLRRPDHLRR
jgi:hypothetical protein